MHRRASDRLESDLSFWGQKDVSWLSSLWDIVCRGWTAGEESFFVLISFICAIRFTEGLVWHNTFCWASMTSSVVSLVHLHPCVYSLTVSTVEEKFHLMWRQTKCGNKTWEEKWLKLRSWNAQRSLHCNIYFWKTMQSISSWKKSWSKWRNNTTNISPKTFISISSTV